MSVEHLDKTNIAILSCLQDAGRPLWKTKIRDYLEENELLEKVVSVQTIGRRIDTLATQGLVESCIVSPDDLHRDLIIAYQITATGTDELARARHIVFDELVSQRLTTEHTISHPTKSLLISLIQEEFDLSEQERKILDEYSTDELVKIVMLECIGRRYAALEDAGLLEDIASQGSGLAALIDRFDFQ